MYQEILYEVNDPVATITFNRPERLNALTERMLAELRHALAQAEADPAVVGIVLTGAGRGFCAGMDMEALSATAQGVARSSDLTELAASPGDPDMGPDFQVTFSYLLSIRKPLIAAVNGPCAGLGFAIALLCDLRFASDKAKFTTSFSQRGLIAEHGMSWILPRLIGPASALDILWSSRKFDGAEAVRLGVASRVIEGDAVVDEARAFIEELAKTASPTSIQVMKQQIYRQLMMPLGDAMRESNRLMGESLTRPDFKEGVASFMERRPPHFARLGRS